jgi:hypothetical protein
VNLRPILYNLYEMLCMWFHLFNQQSSQDKSPSFQGHNSFNRVEYEVHDNEFLKFVDNDPNLSWSQLSCAIEFSTWGSILRCRCKWHTWCKGCKIYKVLWALANSMVHTCFSQAHSNTFWKATRITNVWFSQILKFDMPNTWTTIHGQHVWTHLA